MARFPIRHFPEAVEELEEANDWYAAISPQTVQKWRLAVRQTQASIASTPELWAADRNGVRQVHIKPFPYAIVYRFTKGIVQIVAFAHTSRRQGYWRKRLKGR